MQEGCLLQEMYHEQNVELQHQTQGKGHHVSVKAADLQTQDPSLMANYQSASESHLTLCLQQQSFRVTRGCTIVRVYIM